MEKCIHNSGSIMPKNAQKIRMGARGLEVPDQPVIPFIEGDGTGPDIWRAAVRVLDASVAKAYGGAKQIAWRYVLAVHNAFDQTGDGLPAATLEAFRECLVGIKGSLTTPVGGGIRSLNVALRQALGSLCLPAPALFQHFSRQASGKGGHGDFPREHGKMQRAPAGKSSPARPKPRPCWNS